MMLSSCSTAARWVVLRSSSRTTRARRTRIIHPRVSSFRCKSSADHSSSTAPKDLEGAKKLHKGVEEGLLKHQSSARPPSSSPLFAGSSPHAEDPILLDRQRRTKQALVNAICSFGVVLLAAQSWKSSAQKRVAVRDRDEAEERLAEARRTLRQVTADSTIQAAAAACAREVLESNDDGSMNKSPVSRRAQWWGRAAASRNRDDQQQQQQQQQLQQRLAPVLRHHWQTVVGDAGLTPEELDQKRARETAPSSEVSGDDETTAALLEAVGAAAGLEEEEVREMAQPNEEEDKEVVVKKRVFSI